MRRFTLVAGLIWLALIAWHFPWATDDPVRREDALQAFYDWQYSESQYAQVADNSRAAHGTRDSVARFVQTYHLQSAKVLDVGSGTGEFQDLVADYTGLDISGVVAKHYHKPFVQGTATAMPFTAASFDVVWSIWTLEHIPNPEAALQEIRRVVKPGGYVYLEPAWAVPSWVAQGYNVRAYGDLSLWGKAVKASIPIRSSRLFWLAVAVPVRVIRDVTAIWPTQFRYRRLTPNYEQYWQSDSDAVASLDALETRRWFESRGDVCLNCPTSVLQYLQVQPLIIRRSQ